ncbi:LOW QUALITY PROTEIN: hypothetical protein Cgig2_010697 [Carnegiea gigantea]|uniref:Uncharacterized protein n=1 Tax=Carnegiea gigantea TaxID=171969 RepID=A0A9Q1KKS5_9CARY|nr:LOW QUALITY PROTEIN: hypothetical protein Cgig2_010697 [Carnegiea gigantea]
MRILMGHGRRIRAHTRRPVEFESFNFLSPPFFFQPALFVSFIPSRSPFATITQGGPPECGLLEDLLSLLDDSDTVSDNRNSPSQDLDSVIRSFEEEISGSGTRPGSPKPENFVDLTSDSGDSRPELGQLLGCDDLEAPVAGCECSELVRVSSESSGIGGIFRTSCRNELPSYDSFGFGMGYAEYNNSNSRQGDNDEYVALDGIFDYSVVNFGSYDTWRPETPPALNLGSITLINDPPPQHSSCIQCFKLTSASNIESIGFFPLNNVNINRSKPDANTGKMIFRIKLCFCFLWENFGHGGTCSLDGPQRPGFPMKDATENFTNGPPLGISPSNLLKDTLKYSK